MLNSNQKLKRGKLLLRNTVLGLIAIVATPLVYNWVVKFVTSDPFVGLHLQNSGTLAASIGIRMDDVELRDFNENRLVSSAFAKRVDVQQDRQSATLFNVSRGVYNSEKGPIRYEAAQAVWNFQSGQVNVTKHVAVRNKDLDLHADGLRFEQLSSLLAISGDISGRLYNGDVVAKALVYNMKTGGIDTGPVEWTGELRLSPQDDKSVTPKKWKIKSDGVKSAGSNSDTVIYQNCTASDDDLIVAAPLVQVNRKTDVLTASGGIHYYSGKADIVADRCTIFRKEKRAIVGGHVFMFVKPKSQEDQPPKEEPLPDFKPVAPSQVIATHNTGPLDKDALKAKEDEIRSSKNFREFPLVVVSEKIEYWYAKGNRHATITGAPQMRQALKADEWRHIWAYSAQYDGESEQLKLLSSGKNRDALMKNSLGDEVKAADILVSTKEDDDTFEAHQMLGDIYSSDDDLPKDDKKAVPPPTKSGGGNGKS